MGCTGESARHFVSRMAQVSARNLEHLSSGTGAFDIAALGHGATLARADVDFGATDFAMLLPEGPVAKFDRMSGALTLTHTGDQWSLRGQRVRVARREPESAFDIAWQ